MSFSSGVFSLVAGNPVVTGTTISSTVQNNTMTDVATGLSTCLLKDGTQTATAVVPFAAGLSVPTGQTAAIAGLIAMSGTSSNTGFYKVGTFTRANDGTTADVAYTGIGFKPSMVLFSSAIINTGLGSYCGMDDGTNHFCNYNLKGNAAGNMGVDATHSIVSSDGTNVQEAIVKTMDTDGFTLTWTKVNAPTSGTLACIYIAFR